MQLFVLNNQTFFNFAKQEKNNKALNVSGRNILIGKLRRYYGKYIRKVANSGGHGVHSPFVFNFIIRVIEERARYYSYAAIEELHAKVKQEVKSSHAINLQPLKTSKLLFRIANRLKPITILECGTSCGVSTLALKSACSNSRIVTIEPDAEIAKYQPGAVVEDYSVALPKYYTQNPLPEMIYIRRQQSMGDYKTIFATLMQNFPEKQVIVIEGIRTNKAIYAQFKEFVSDKTIKVTIDMYDTAILVVSSKLNKQHFKVAF